MLAKTRPIETAAQLFDDFFSYDTGRWPTDTNDGGTGTVAVTVAAGGGGGVLSIATAGAANDYHVISSGKSIELLAGRPVIFEVRFKVTESAANASHWAIGLTDTLTGGWLADTTGAALASYKGMMLWKPTGAATIKAETANGSTKNVNAAVGTFVSGAWTTVGAAFDPGDGTTGWVQFLLNGQGSDATGRPIKRLPITLSGLTPVCLTFAIKASTSTAETMLVDYAGVDIGR